MSKIRSEHIFCLAFALLSFGLLYSRFLISIGMLFFLLVGLMNLKNTESFKGFFKNKYYLAVTGVFFIFLISGLWSENTEYFLNRMRIKLPFFFLPFAFYASPKLERKTLDSLILGFIALISFSVFVSFCQFMMDFEHYIAIYGKGQILPTPIHHVRYSILVSISILMCIYLVFKKSEVLFRHQNKVLIFLAVMMILYQHLLAVRSGLMTLYVMLGVVLVFIGRLKAYRKLSLYMLLGFVLLGTLSVLYVPTVKNKIGYMKYSLELFAKNENIRELSDSRRLGSIYAGVQLIKENPILGVGIGDLMDETNKYLEEHYPELTDLELLPHNQYILTATSAGLIALLLFIYCTAAPFFYNEGYKDLFVCATQWMLIASFMVEHTIESQIGVAAYIFIVLFSMKNTETEL